MAKGFAPLVLKPQPEREPIKSRSQFRENNPLLIVKISLYFPQHLGFYLVDSALVMF